MITALAAELCAVPICLITFDDGDRVRIQSEFGWGSRELPDRPWFTETNQSEELLEIADTGDEKFRFYAGVPLRTPSGVPLGAICLLGHEPRTLTSLERRTLTMLAHQVMAQLNYRHTVELLKARNADLDETARIARVGKWVCDLETDELVWSDIVFDIFGISREQFSGDMRSFLGAVHPSDLAAVTAAQHHAMLGKPLDIEHRVCRPDGAIRWVHERGELVHNADGVPVYIAGTVQDITERKTLTRDLETLFEISKDLICIASTDGFFERVNPAFERSLGWSREQLLAKPIIEFSVQQDREETAKELERLAKGEPSLNFLSRFATREGGVRTLDWTSISIPEEHAIYAIGRDVTEERSLQQEIERSEKQLSETLESMTDAFLALDRDWRVTFVNRHAELLLRRDRTALLQNCIWDIFPEAVGSVFQQQYRQALELEQPVIFEEYFAPLEKWFELRAFPSRQGLGIYFRDITDRKRATEQVRLLGTSISRLNDMVVITEAEPLSGAGPKIVFVNEAFERQTGFSREEAVGRTPRILQGPETSRLELDRIRKALERREPVRAELVNYTKSGKPFWVEMEIVPVADETGVYRHFVAIQRDITERRRADRNLKDTADRYQLLFEGNPLPMWVFDIETFDFLAVNLAATQKYGYSRQEFLAMNIRDIRATDQVPALEEAVRAGGAGPTESGVWKHLAKDGRTIVAEVHTQPIEFAGRAARLVLPIDITDRLKLEEQLLQAQKMETIGRLAGGVAHDFNNLLTVINGYAQMLLNRAPEPGLEGESRQRILKHILRSGERAAQLTAQLLAFSRQQVLQPKRVAINEVLEGMKTMLLRLIREDIEISWVLGEEIGAVNLDPLQFEQVVLNLALNARDAMPNGGYVTIETGRAQLDDAYCHLHPDVTPGQYAMISVSDTGHGMEPDIVKRVFEPFFTTKGKGFGTGLGLSTVYGIVKQSGGHINVYSEVGLGTRFKVYFPVVEGEAMHIEVEESVVDDLSGTETILLVEDDTGVREYAAGILRDLGYQVVEASSGPNAIIESEKHSGTIDLLLTDVVMPKLNGRDLAEFICGRRPEIKVLFMSGYTENAIVHHGVLDQGLHFLAKPFSPVELGRKIRAVIATPRRPKRVLILDDEAGVRDFIQDTLGAAGYETLHCENGSEALRHLKLGPVDLLITDLIMPGQEGIETITRVRKEFPHLKILALSGYAAGDYLKLARALGANQTLSKPIDVQVLRDGVKAMIGESVT